jgi:hypothetical protein
LVGNQETPGNVRKTHTRAMEEKEYPLRYDPRTGRYPLAAGLKMPLFPQPGPTCLPVLVPGDVARQLPKWAHLPLGQTQPLWDSMTVAAFGRGSLKTEG